MITTDTSEIMYSLYMHCNKYATMLTLFSSTKFLAPPPLSLFLTILCNPPLQQGPTEGVRVVEPMHIEDVAPAAAHDEVGRDWAMLCYAML